MTSIRLERFQIRRSGRVDPSHGPCLLFNFVLTKTKPHAAAPLQVADLVFWPYDFQSEELVFSHFGSRLHSLEVVDTAARAITRFPLLDGLR